jgi:hypothetical protein
MGVCRGELEEILEWLQWAKAAYKGDNRALASAMQVRGFLAPMGCCVSVMRGTGMECDLGGLWVGDRLRRRIS